MVKPAVILVPVGLLLAVPVTVLASQRADTPPGVASAPVPRDSARIGSGQSDVLRRLIAADLRNTTLDDALQAIASRGNVRLIYNDAVVPLAKRVSLRAARISVGDALASLLRDTGVALKVAPTGEVALVRADDTKRRNAVTSLITGRITDAKTGAHVVGAEVLLEGTPWRAATDTGGRYRFVDVDTGAYTLTARRLGYAKQSRKIIVRAGREDTVDVAMQPAATRLDELITTATGKQRRRDLGNAITTIQADSVLEAAPIRTLSDLLASRVPGLTAQRTSGAPGDPTRIRLRGLGSVLSSNDPVFIVDGVRMYAAQSAQRAGNLANGIAVPTPTGDGLPQNRAAPSPIDQIDPNTIEKIEVFQGPSAATIYGADAANGVVVITTKKGRPGPTRWNAVVRYGRTTVPGKYPTAYYRFGRVMFRNIPRFCTLLERACVQDSLVRYQALNDPEYTVFGTGRTADLSLTASGGSQTLTYSITGTVSDETGYLKLPAGEIERFRTRFNREAPDWMRDPQGMKRWGVLSNVTAQLGRTMDVGLSMTLSRAEQRTTMLEQNLPLLAGTYIDPINAIYLRPNVYGMLTASNDVLRDYYMRTTASSLDVRTGLRAGWRPRAWFDVAATAGLHIIPRDDQMLLPSGFVTDSGVFSRATGRSLEGTFNVQGTIRKMLGRGFIFRTAFGTDLTTRNTADLASSATGLVPGTSTLNGATGVRVTESRFNSSVFGWFIEPQISSQRFAISTGLRLDGGSAYGARLTGGSGSGLFGGLLALPKLNGAWVISEEPFFPFKAFFSSLKLRGAYGQAQTQPVVSNQLRLYAMSPTGYGDTLGIRSLGNTQLRAERKTDFEGGFDADLLDSRVSIELTAYHKMTVDALLPVTLPGSVNGGGSVVTNIGNIRNTGVTLGLGITPLRSVGATWSAQLNYSHNNNTLVKLGPGVLPNPANGMVAGYPVGGRFARPIVGFADQNGDGLISREEVQLGDTQGFMGQLLPVYTASLHNDIRLFNGAIGVNAVVTYDAGQTQINQTVRDNWVLSRALVDPSAPFGEQAAVVASSPGIDGLWPATDYGLMQKLSTFRFRSLSVRYTAPPSIARFVRAERLSIALQGDNLALRSNYRGMDPDVTAWSPGENVVDTGQLPQPRLWQLSVNMDF